MVNNTEKVFLQCVKDQIFQILAMTYPILNDYIFRKCLRP